MSVFGDIFADAKFDRDLWGQAHRSADADRLRDVACKLILFCLLYILGAALIWPTIFSEMTSIYLSELERRGSISFILVIVPAAIIASPGAPTRFMMDLICSSWERAVLFVTIFTLSLAAFTTYKLNIPDILPFYGDRTIADLDEFLHGRAPWRIAHAFDSDTLAWLVSLAYSKIWFLEWFGMAFFAALSANRPIHLRYLVALAFTISVVGTFLATLFSSVGPVFYDQFLHDPRYAELLKVLSRRPCEELGIADYLLQNYKTGTAALGSGISAMPSMHVAIATLNAFYLARLNRWLGVVGWGFALFILFGSVYTGWHYAVDGYVAMFVVAVIWRRSARLFEDRAPAPRLTQDASYPSPTRA